MNHYSSIKEVQRVKDCSGATRVGIGMLSLLLLAGTVPTMAETDSLSRELVNELRSNSQFLSKTKKAKALKKVKRALRLKNDFYYFKGKRMALSRSLDEIVVRFKSRLTLQEEDSVVKDFTLSGKAMGKVDLPSGAYSVYSLKEKQLTAEHDLQSLMSQLESHTEIGFVSPVFVNEETGTKMTLTQELVAKLRLDQTKEDLQSVAAALGLAVDRRIAGTENQYVLRVKDPKQTDPLAVANTLHNSGVVEWCEPNFIQEYQLFSVPDDPRYPMQWHLDNTGQGGGIPGASVEASAAWDLEEGSPDITIAVLDDGVQLTHPDLVPNLFSNPEEIPDNGIDDDKNGYVDDVHGWDFANKDNDPNPFLNSGGFGPDSHGTSVSGVAAAKGNNNLGVTGACQHCKILPVKIANSPGAGQNFVNFSNDQAAEAIRYAASLADVLNNSWGGGAPSNVIQEAIQFASTQGRDGKGAPVFFATGNGSNGAKIKGLTIPAGTHRIMWEYSKDANGQAGDDGTWLSWVRFPGGEVVDFEDGALSDGWTTSTENGWAVMEDAVHGDEGRCIVHPVKSAKIGPNQTSVLEVVKTVEEGRLDFYTWISSEPDSDGLRLIIDYDNDGTIDFRSVLLSGVPNTIQQVGYPAAFPEAIAVGASTNFDCRAGYSQFGLEVDVVAPSSGGPLNLRVTTTDRTGTDGYDTDDYLPNESGSTGFGGTSSATPLVSGVAGLMLSRNPELTAQEVRSILQETADQIGPDSYIDGRNNRYGHGRVNASRALQAITPPIQVVVPEMSEPVPGSTLSGSEVVFSWTTGTGIDQYRLTMGSTKGANDLFDSHETVVTTVAVSNIPLDGRTLFVRLFHQANGEWQFMDYQYTAAKQGQVVTKNDLRGYWWNPGSKKCFSDKCWERGFVYRFSTKYCFGGWCGGSRQGWMNKGSGWRPTSRVPYPFAWRLQENRLVLFFFHGYRIEVFQISDYDPATGKLNLSSRHDPNAMFFKFK